jgi:hypothetical protein
MALLVHEIPCYECIFFLPVILSARCWVMFLFNSIFHLPSSIFRVNSYTLSHVVRVCPLVLKMYRPSSDETNVLFDGRRLL